MPERKGILLFKKINIKIPGIHYRIESPEVFQAFLLIAVGLAAIPVLQENLGMTYEVALTAVAIAEALGLLHVFFGDPVVPGWIASAMPLVLVYLGGYQPGRDTIYAMIALQLLLSMLFLVLGATGLAHKLMKTIPSSIKAGILLGAAFAAVNRVFKEGSYFEQFPYSIAIGTLITYFILFSNHFKALKEKHAIFERLSKYGMLPGLLAAMIIGPLAGEFKVPVIEWGLIPFAFRDLFEGYSVFSIGFPPVSYFIRALPMTFAVYIIAFGEIITAEAVLKEAKEVRPEAHIVYNSNISNVVAGIRNLVLALFVPFVPLAGPLWAAVSVAIGERFKGGAKGMQSIFSGMGTFKLSTAFFVLLLPVASLCKPVLPIALAITLMVQGIACSYIAIDQTGRDKVAAGIAGITGAIVFSSEVGYGILVGLILCLLMEKDPFKLKKQKAEL